MKRSRASFQLRLLIDFLAAGAVPLIACVALILGIFRATLTESAQTAAQNSLAALTGAMGGLVADCGDALDRLGEDALVAAVLEDGIARDTGVYSVLYRTAAPLLRDADFSLYDGRGRLCYTTGPIGPWEDLPVDWGLLWAAREQGGLICRKVSDFDDSPRGRMRLCRAVRNGAGTVGYAVAEWSEEHFARLFEETVGTGNDVVVTDPFWDPVYASPALREEDPAAAIRAALLQGRGLTDESGEYTYHANREDASGFLILLRQTRPVTARAMQIFYGIAGASVAVCLLLCLWFSMGFSRRIFAPIRALNTAMAQVEQGDLGVRLPVAGTDEIHQLSGRFNRMTDRLGANLSESLRQQRELGETRIRMMQAQLNPHFLYNTLDTLKWLGKINRVEEVSTISADLADILRRSISAERFVSLREELELLERYVEIQKIRFPGKFEYRPHVESEDLLDAQIPKLLLQPLVENAIIHGFEDGSAGQIDLTAERHGGELILTVRDDGVGMSEESRMRFLSHAAPKEGEAGHLGIYNVDAILRLHYGETGGLRLLPTEKGTCLRIILPIRKADAEP